MPAHVEGWAPRVHRTGGTSSTPANRGNSRPVRAVPPRLGLDGRLGFAFRFVWVVALFMALLAFAAFYFTSWSARRWRRNRRAPRRRPISPPGCKYTTGSIKCPPRLSPSFSHPPAQAQVAQVAQVGAAENRPRKGYRPARERICRIWERARRAASGRFWPLLRARRSQMALVTITPAPNAKPKQPSAPGWALVSRSRATVIRSSRIVSRPKVAGCGPAHPPLLDQPRRSDGRQVSEEAECQEAGKVLEREASRQAAQRPVEQETRWSLTLTTLGEPIGRFGSVCTLRWW
jgi:hypothetical protein